MVSSVIIWACKCRTQVFSNRLPVRTDHLQISHIATADERNKDWESDDKRNAWQTNSAYGPATKDIASILTDKGELYEVDFASHEESLKAFSAPITELVRFYFEGDAPETYFDDFRKAGEKLREDGVRGIVATAAGITIEDHEHDGVKGKVAIVVVGWESLEHHMEFLKSQTMQDTSTLLRSSSKAIKFNHVNFTLKGQGAAAQG